MNISKDEIREIVSAAVNKLMFALLSGNLDYRYGNEQTIEYPEDINIGATIEKQIDSIVELFGDPEFVRLVKISIRDDYEDEYVYGVFSEPWGIAYAVHQDYLGELRESIILPALKKILKLK